jgi:hypothetical protein
MLACPLTRPFLRAVKRPGTCAFKAWVWLLLCAVLLQGGAGAVVQVLGRAHTHTVVQAVPAPSWLGSFLAWRETRLQALQARSVFWHATAAPAGHHHDGLERHHHAPGDATVQAVDSAGSDATAGTSSAELAWGPTAEYCVGQAAPADAAWPDDTPSPAWSSALTRLPERPPRA